MKALIFILIINLYFNESALAQKECDPLTDLTEELSKAFNIDFGKNGLLENGLTSMSLENEKSIVEIKITGLLSLSGKIELMEKSNRRKKTIGCFKEHDYFADMSIEFGKCGSQNFIMNKVKPYVDNNKKRVIYEIKDKQGRLLRKFTQPKELSDEFQLTDNDGKVLATYNRNKLKGDWNIVSEANDLSVYMAPFVHQAWIDTTLSFMGN
jgi:hypothetical protein